MLEAIVKKSESIVELCRRNGVSRLELFGSAAREADFDPATSDLNFTVDFEPAGPVERFRKLLVLQDDLASLFKREVDLVEIRDVKNPYVLKTVLEDKRPVYVAESAALVPERYSRPAMPVEARHVFVTRRTHD